MRRPKIILILGCGAAGYACYRRLKKLLRPSLCRIIVVDDSPCYVFVPLLHEVGAGVIPPSAASVPFSRLIQPPDEHIMARLISLDPERKIATTTAGEMGYDYAVLATGSTTNFFNTPGAKEHSYTIRSLAEAERLHKAIKEKMEYQEDQKPLSIAIVGGGFTGVEIAGTLGSLAHRLSLQSKDAKKIAVHIIQGGDLLAPMLREQAGRRTEKIFQKLGVAIHCNTRVKEVTPSSVIISDGKEIESDITVWCAGFIAETRSLLPKNMSSLEGVTVNEFLEVPGAQNLYGMGDAVRVLDRETQKPYAMLAERGEQEGTYLAKRISRSIQKRTPSERPFAFHSKGTLLPVGERWGVGAFFNNRLVLYGFLPLLIKRMVYLWYFPTVRAKYHLLKTWLVS